ncbi:Reverse transcriptase, partial [Phytophthora palmivora]
TRHSVLKWVIKSKTADGHLVPWGVALSQYDLETRKVHRDEDGLAAILGASITPREHLDKIAESLIPTKGRVKAPPVISIEMLEADYTGVVLSFDGAAKTSTRIGSCGCVLWQLHEWKVIDARGYILDGVTVNDAEYFGLLRGLAMARDRGIQDLVVVHQERDQYLSDIIAFLKDELERFSPKRLKKIAKVADLFALDIRGVLYRLARGKGSPPNAGLSPGNIEPTRPFEAVSMDFVTHLPESVRGNTFLLLFQDMFSGYVMCKPMASTTAQDVAEAYEESVFRRIGASSVIRHDQDPRFMSEVFARFRDLIGSKQRATLAYRPQANGQQERSVQTVIRSVKAYVAEADQSDWDEHAERLMFALNTSFDATRLDTPFYLVHGWDAQGTVSAMLGPRPSTLPERTAYEWRRKFQRDYSYALACAEELQRKAKRSRSEEQTRKWRELSDRLKAGFEKGDAVWLYIPKVQPGLSRKLAHLWHGPFRIEDVRDDIRVKLKVEDSGYRVNPWVHICRLKQRAIFPRRPKVEVEVEDDDDLTWHYYLTIVGSQTMRTTKYLVKWKGYADPEWIPVSQLSCGALLYESNKGASAKARFQAMQAGEDHPRA